MKCPTCGAENDPANRFCDQCGTPLNAETPAQAVAAAPASGAAATTCPTCGAAVVPGEAFCDECGSPLSAAPVVTDAPSGAAVPNAAAAEVPVTNTVSTAGTEQTVTCPSCGHANLAGDHFCENCGASLTASATSTPAASSAAPETQPSQPEATATASANGQAAAVDGSAPPVTETAEVMAQELPAADQLGADQLAAPEAVGAPAPVDEAQAAPTVEQPAAPTEAPAVTSAPTSTDAESQRLQDEIARQDLIIAQFEQMQTMFGANVPAAVTQGLAEARDARARAEADLNALAPAAPPIDPAEVARLQDEIARQEQIIAQFEQMQTMFGANAPAAVTQGLAEARDARDRVSSELQALTGGAGGTVAAQPMPAVPEPAGAPTATQEAPTAVAQAQAPVEQAPTPAAQPRASRLVVESNGAEISFPEGKTELVIGREDPISGIFPEIDLTTYGGESGGVSRQHAKLVNTNGQWAVVDLNSTNYTRVDGAKLEPNVPTPVRDGSRIQLGRVVVVFHE